jgi:type II secretory pathway pseudopilin PulG
MIKPAPIRRRPKPSEEGYILIAVMFMLAILVIALSVAVPKISKQIQRDRELETMHRGKQYVRGVKMYYKKFGAYPPSIDALVKTNEIRFLRKKYIDPTTGKDEWKIIRFGQNKTQSMGFFGQPIGGSTLAGIGPSGGNGLTGSPGVGGGIGSSPGAGSVFGSTSSTSTDPGTSPTSPAGANPGSPGSTGPTGSSSNTDPNSPGGNGTGTGSGTGSGTGLTGQTFGGGGIIGVSPGGTKQSILVYKKKNHYNEWEFFYDPMVDQMMMQGGNAGTIGQPAGSTTTPVGGASGTSGAPGTAPGTSSPGAPATPPSPQQ